MELISAALSEKNLTVEQLSQELQGDIAELQNMAKKFNEACDEYESLEETDDETEKNLDKMEEQIMSFQQDIAQEIKSFNVPAPQEDKQDVKKSEKSSSMGWLLFGGVALVVTLGVVNVFKKK